ncbi:predicted protein [Naegleria gruberi]|uniref:Predicted protein n=1 Tax=Naegleria gruberi TaxID=5762 RepID=D2V0M1_NAEGR|nr:uncharacterized protein NAEGRDRAFT_62342 [Naegleria gruberi]EFC49746.1 predicted protein [Naegleria gruberi]|eukprot:XP_002682490.1 predicted protein [Naegleria gruberi strain NEG-M]
MRFLTFTSSLIIYLLAAIGCLLSWMYYVNDAPWTIDNNSNNALLGSSNLSMDQFLSSLKSDSFSDPKQASQIVKQLLTAQYQFSALCFLLSSALILLIVFFATRNRTLTLWTHVALSVWLILFGLVLKPYSQQSLHNKIYYFALVGNFIALALYAVHLRNIRALRLEKQAEKKTE